MEDVESTDLLTGYQIGGFFLDIQQLQLTKANKIIPISPRGILLLKHLAAHSPQPIKKTQLLAQLWPDTVVSDWALARLLSDTRRLLDDDGDKQIYIRTAKGIGYSLHNVSICYQHNDVDDKQPSKFNWRFISIILLLSIGIIFVAVKYYKQYQLKQAIEIIAENQIRSFANFKVQITRRAELVSMMEARLKVKRQRQYEKFFATHYEQMNTEERFVCSQMRAITDTGLYTANNRIYTQLKQQPKILEQIPHSLELQQHLEFWLNKYHSVFRKRQDMCLLYVGVEDNRPYPSAVDKEIISWLEK